MLKSPEQLNLASSGEAFPCLQVSGLKKHFGGVKALDGVDFAVLAGQCVALIGPNGAGKSTCFSLLAGQQRPDAGSVRWAGEDITGLPPAALHARGVGRTFQVAQVFEALTVLQNVQLTMQQIRRRSGFFPIKNQSLEASGALLARLGLTGWAQQLALNLPYGVKKRLELAIALAGAPRLLLLDEPAAGLAQDERRDLMALVRSLARGSLGLVEGQGAAPGLAVLYTEHNMDAVFGVADRVLVLIDGKLAAQGTPAEIAANSTVRQRYLGAGFAAGGRHA